MPPMRNTPDQTARNQGVAVELSSDVREEVDRVVGEYCEMRIPSHVRDKIRVVYEVRGEQRDDPRDAAALARRHGLRNGPRRRSQLRHEDKKWLLYWSDRHGRWFLYDQLGPTENLFMVLEETDRDPTGIFWGRRDGRNASLVLNARMAERRRPGVARYCRGTGGSLPL